MSGAGAESEQAALTLSQLREKIKEIAREEVSRRGDAAGTRIDITASALDFLAKRPKGFQMGHVQVSSNKYDIDIALLKSTITKLIFGANLREGKLNSGSLKEAMKKSECHYLWFC